MNPTISVFINDLLFYLYPTVKLFFSKLKCSHSYQNDSLSTYDATHFSCKLKNNFVKQIKEKQSIEILGKLCITLFVCIFKGLYIYMCPMVKEYSNIRLHKKKLSFKYIFSKNFESSYSPLNSISFIDYHILCLICNHLSKI